MIAGLGFAGFSLVARAEPPVEKLQTVAAIRDLNAEQAQQKPPVQLHGVVTFFDDSLYSRFIQDDTAGIYLQFPLNVAPPTLLPGQGVDVTGTVSPREYAPVVMVNEVHVTYEQLASGTEDSKFFSK